jgi:hypothetical protein
MPANLGPSDLLRILRIQGDQILLRPTGAEEFSILGMFEISFFDRDLNGRKLKTAMPFFVAISADLKGLKVSDSIVYQEKIYFVSSIDDDGHGVSRVELREEYEPSRDDERSAESAEDYLARLKRPDPKSDRK